MNKLLILIGAAALAGATAKVLIDLPSARITFRAIDEDGKVIENARVKMSFEQVGAAGALANVEGVTDSRGEFSGEGGSSGENGGLIYKEGYYFARRSKKFTKVVDRRWEPWNPTLDVLLKKVINPIPMYARRVGFNNESGQIPGAGRPAGFDLIASDWVAPYGKGLVGDFVFTLERNYVKEDEFQLKLKLSFSNKGDGLCRVEGDPVLNESYMSELRMARRAPENGYEPEFVTSLGQVPGRSLVNEARDDRNYFFRIRTRLGSKGEIVGALYGKIYEDFSIQQMDRSQTHLHFTYHLNPNNLDRNMEFDPKRNLLSGLSQDEKVRAP